MAIFEDWALKYVLTDDDKVLKEIAEAAAQEIQNSKANTTVVGNWAASIKQWISGPRDDEIEGADSGDVIARSKALEFLAATLEALDRTTLKADQVRRLVTFFATTFSLDHKAGISAATRSMQQLCRMSNFDHKSSVTIVDAVTKLGDDFRLQVPATRLQIYQLLLYLGDKFSGEDAFILELLQLAQHERDPQNLLVWFALLRHWLSTQQLSSDKVEAIFKAFSAYFPITLRSTATPAGVTAEDLKSTLRQCFSAHQDLAPHTLPYLLQKLDQGDAVTVAVKVDILRTIKACVDEYSEADKSIVPYSRKIWDSLKYEVRNGEAKETIDATLDVLRAISNKLQPSARTLTLQPLQNYLDMVFQDCKDDLSNPTYTKQSGLLINTVLTANPDALILNRHVYIAQLEKHLRQPQSPRHLKDLVAVCNMYLKSRVDVVTHQPLVAQDEGSKADDEIQTLFYNVYLPIWRDVSIKSDDVSVNIFKEVVDGLGLLVSQKVHQTSSDPSKERLALPTSVCAEITALLSQRLLDGLSLSANEQVHLVAQDNVNLALRTVVSNYTEGFRALVDRAMAEIGRKSWNSSTPSLLGSLKDILTKLAFIGCSLVPQDVDLDSPPTQPYSPLQHISKTVAELLGFLSPHSPLLDNHEACGTVVAIIHGAILNFFDACQLKYGDEALKAQSKGSENWIDEFHKRPDDWLWSAQGQQIGSSLTSEDPAVYNHFLKLSLYSVYLLYRQSRLANPAWFDNSVRTKTSSMAVSVIRKLDEDLQKSCHLGHEAFELFSQPGETESTTAFGGDVLLTLGILEGLWPSALDDLYAPNGPAYKYACDLDGLKDVSYEIHYARAAMCAVLANKFRRGRESVDPQAETVKAILSFWADRLSDGVNDPPETAGLQFAAITTVFMHTLTGALARMDRSALEFIPGLHKALASPHSNGEIVANAIEALVLPGAVFASESHAVVKPLYKQWVYHFVAQPLYKQALPPTAGPAATRYTMAILGLVIHCPFSAYETDLSELVRLLITVIGDRPVNQPSTAATSTTHPQSSFLVVNALRVLINILDASPTALTGHLNTIIKGTVQQYEAARRRPVSENASDGPQLKIVDATVRRFALQVLGALPAKFETRHLLAHAPRMQQVLATATGDSGRATRAAARLARASWLNVV